MSQLCQERGETAHGKNRKDEEKRHRRARKSEEKAGRRGAEGETGASEVYLLLFTGLGPSPHVLGPNTPLQQLLSKIKGREHSVPLFSLSPNALSTSSFPQGQEAMSLEQGTCGNPTEVVPSDKHWVVLAEGGTMLVVLGHSYQDGLVGFSSPRGISTDFVK